MKTTRRFTTLLLVLSILVHLQCSKSKKEDNPGAEPRVTLKQSYPPGKYLMVMGIDQKQEIEGEGEPQSMQTTMTMEMLLDVSQPGADGSTTVKMAYTRFAMKGGGMDVDTNMPAVPPGTPQGSVDRIYRAMVGHELTMTLSADGKVVGVSGFEQLWEKLASIVPEGGEAMLAALKNEMNDESLKKMMAGGEEFMPPNAVGVGAVWHSSSTTKAPMVGDMDIEFECELTELTNTPAGKIARIAFTGTLQSEGGGSVPGGGGGVQIGGMEMTHEGSLRMNVDTGLPAEMTARQVGTIDMSVQPPRGKKLDMTSHMDQTITMTVTSAE